MQGLVQKADTIIVNAVIYTGNPLQPYAEAMAIAGESILLLGTRSSVEKLSNRQTQIIDAGKQFICPGFIDAHLHFFMGGFNLTSVQLRSAPTPDEFIRRIAAFTKQIPKGTWITGGEWDHHNWGGTLPDKSWIDKVTPDHPVFISRLDGHMALANTLAMQKTGIVSSVTLPAGGAIVKNEQGELSGIFKDNAMALISRHIPPYSKEQIDQAIDAAMNYLAAQGVTSVHHMWESSDRPEYFDALLRARDEKRLLTRISHSNSLKDFPNEAVHFSDFKEDHWLKTGALKWFADGSLGSHTAAFKQPYADQPDDRGILVSSEEELYNMVRQADLAGRQVQIHAIGDQAVAQVLDVYQAIEEQHPKRDRRFRIEHAQHVAPEDLERFARYKVIASVQPYQLIDDGRWAEQLIGSGRLSGTHAYRSLINTGTLLAAGSDWPVAPPSPLKGIDAAVTRRTLDGQYPEGWIPQQKITVKEALDAYTCNAAYAAFDEKHKGTLAPGKLADFVILNENLLTSDPLAIKDIVVKETWLGGRKVYENK